VLKARRLRWRRPAATPAAHLSAAVLPDRVARARCS
jgi:hypothetical protein